MTALVRATATPGPWQRSGVRVRLRDEDCIAVGPDGHSIAVVPIGRGGKDHASAIRDASLIAAAQDMRAALVLALEYWSHRQQRYRNRAPVWVQNARDALAKAGD